MAKFIKLTDLAGKLTILEVSHVTSVDNREDEDVGEYAAVTIEVEDRLVTVLVLETVEDVWQQLRKPLDV